MQCVRYNRCGAETNLTCQDEIIALDYCRKRKNYGKEATQTGFNITPINIQEGSIPNGILTFENGIPSWKVNPRAR